MPSAAGRMRREPPTIVGDEAGLPQLIEQARSNANPLLSSPRRGAGLPSGRSSAHPDRVDTTPARPPRRRPYRSAPPRYNLINGTHAQAPWAVPRWEPRSFHVGFPGNLAGTGRLLLAGLKMRRTVRCPNCRGAMRRTGFDRKGYGETVFHYKCPKCGQVGTKTVGEPARCVCARLSVHDRSWRGTAADQPSVVATEVLG